MGASVQGGQPQPRFYGTAPGRSGGAETRAARVSARQCRMAGDGGESAIGEERRKGAARRDAYLTS